MRVRVSPLAKKNLSKRFKCESSLVVRHYLAKVAHTGSIPAFRSKAAQVSCFFLSMKKKPYATTTNMIEASCTRLKLNKHYYFVILCTSSHSLEDIFSSFFLVPILITAITLNHFTLLSLKEDMNNCFSIPQLL